MAIHVPVLSQKGWEATAALPEAVTIQLGLILEQLHMWKGRPFTVDLPRTHLWTDASDFGLGATMHEQIATHGWFMTTEGHIGGKEFLAAIYTIQAYLLQDTEVHLHVDNMVFFHYLRTWGGKVRRLISLMREIGDYCQRMNVHILPH